jgi:type II secretion system protein I
MRPETAARPGSAGFTLLEMLVALAILGVVLVTVYGIFGNGLRGASRDEDRLLLALVAQNLLVRGRLDLDARQGPIQGDIQGGLRWEITSEPYKLPEGLLPEAPPPGAEEPRLLGDEARTANGQERQGGGLSGPSDRDAGGLGAGGRDQGFGQEDGQDGFGSSGGFGREGGPGSEEGGLGSEESGLGSGEGGLGSDRGPGGRPAEREPVRLRLIRVTVEKGGERVDLTGLATEPRRERQRGPGLGQEGLGQEGGFGQEGFGSRQDSPGETNRDRPGLR